MNLASGKSTGHSVRSRTRRRVHQNAIGPVRISSRCDTNYRLNFRDGSIHMAHVADRRFITECGWTGERPPRGWSFVSVALVRRIAAGSPEVSSLTRAFGSFPIAYRAPLFMRDSHQRHIAANLAAICFLGIYEDCRGKIL